MKRWQDAQFVPGAVKYGDLPSLLSLSAPHRLWIGDESDGLTLVAGAYESWDAADAVTFDRGSGNAVSDAVTWLVQDQQTSH